MFEQNIITLNNSICYLFPNRKEVELSQMNSKVENEKSLVAHLQKMVKELQVILYQTPVNTCL